MRARTKIKGFKELDRKLGRLARTFSERKNAQTAVEAAEIVLDEMRALVPERSGALSDSLGVVDDGVTVSVGPVRGEGAWWRAHFIEFGTVHHGAQPFILPAFDNTQDQVITKIGKTLVAEIDKAKE